MGRNQWREEMREEYSDPKEPNKQKCRGGNLWPGAIQRPTWPTVVGWLFEEVVTTWKWWF